jgi:hypothetical protein
MLTGPVTGPLRDVEDERPSALRFIAQLNDGRDLPFQS